MRRPKIFRSFATLPVIAALVLAAAGIYGFTGLSGKVESQHGQSPLKSFATGTLAGFLLHEQHRDIAPFTFKNEANADVDLGHFKGKVVLLNLWATWCAPCREEMPDFAALQKQLGGDDFEVVALSIDRKGAEASAAFLKEVGADELKLYTDVDAASLAALQAVGLPATMLIDREGKEVGRLLGPAKWAAPEVVALIDAVVKAAPATTPAQ